MPDVQLGLAHTKASIFTTLRTPACRQQQGVGVVLIEGRQQITCLQADLDLIVPPPARAAHQ